MLYVSTICRDWNWNHCAKKRGLVQLPYIAFCPTTAAVPAGPHIPVSPTEEKHLKLPLLTSPAKSIFLFFILEYSKQFSQFRNNEWLWVWLTHLSQLHMNSAVCHTHTFFSQSQSHLWISEAAAVTGSGYFVPQTLTTFQAGSWPAEDLCLSLSRPVQTEANVASDTLLREVLL